MELLIGGCFQGKLDYAKKKWEDRHISITEHNIVDGSYLAALGQGQIDREIKIIDRLHLLVRACEKEDRGEEIFSVLEAILLSIPDIVLIGDEVGLGIVPVDRQECQYREAVGRMLCFLAGRAERVERIIAGMPVRIK